MLFRKKHQEEQEPFVYRIFGATLGAVILFLIEVLQIVIIAALIIVPVRLYVVKPFIVKGASMEPNFYDSEYLIIDEITYRFRDIERGEIIVFEPPGDPGQFYIKRVIALPGETVEIEEGVIRIFNDEYPNGIELEEEYIEEYTHGRERVTLGLNEYYVLGDNRDASLDSRKFGPIKRDVIIGRAWVRGLPVDRIGTIDHPDYTF